MATELGSTPLEEPQSAQNFIYDHIHKVLGVESGCYVPATHVPLGHQNWGGSPETGVSITSQDVCCSAQRGQNQDGCGKQNKKSIEP